MSRRYPADILDEYDDNGIMPANVEALAEAVVGHKIVSAEQTDHLPVTPQILTKRHDGLLLTLDNGQRVLLANTDDCCAHTELEAFLLHPEMVDHVITGVETTDRYTRWHIYADLGDVLELTVDWSGGNVGYYGYGFAIDVLALPETREVITP